MKTVIVDYRTSNVEIENLKKLGCKILLCPAFKNLYNAICGHPDIQIQVLEKNKLIVHKDIDINFLHLIKSQNVNVIFSKNNLESKYPKDIILNAVNTDNFFMHNLKYTDNSILTNLKNKKLLNVNQGYTKCSTAIVKNNAFMTSDLGIANALNKEGMDVLLLPPGDILLPGLNYGFIGGCCGLIEENLMAFFGNLDYYIYKKDVIDFLKKHNVEPFFLKKGKLIDRGSILNI
ncbi:hypothetical protein CLOACE_12830 [Clostridium acetireducens DSM 10703]|jgi:hypothetical protein|uniref:DUF6873 domain-containing protein n=1 Tax=Clostridium acetireducens DSM 10703 TaxID=1121290 RepID=A0A1E8EYU8_9CLOT|nr:hypothetical protein [Clostridium acetireducens]OFI06135.1 hypothetical protein CLOACE_12830 [Clostridium acetireducens DSM 10703]